MCVCCWLGLPHQNTEEKQPCHHDIELTFVQRTKILCPCVTHTHTQTNVNSKKGDKPFHINDPPFQRNVPCCRYRRCWKFLFRHIPSAERVNRIYGILFVYIIGNNNNNKIVQTGNKYWVWLVFGANKNQTKHLSSEKKICSSNFYFVQNENSFPTGSYKKTQGTTKCCFFQHSININLNSNCTMAHTHTH